LEEIVFTIRRYPDHKFFAPPAVPKRWTEKVSLAVHYPDKKLAEEQAVRLPYPVDVIPVSQ
jgi:hypothetical protein